MKNLVYLVKSFMQGNKERLSDLCFMKNILSALLQDEQRRMTERQCGKEYLTPCPSSCWISMEEGMLNIHRPLHLLFRIQKMEVEKGKK